MREFKYGVGVIATIFLLNLLLVKLSEKSSTKTDFRGKNQKDMSGDGTYTAAIYKDFTQSDIHRKKTFSAFSSYLLSALRKVIR